jgi:branched-chain amino acid transport system substrate-binding protein
MIQFRFLFLVTLLIGLYTELTIIEAQTLDHSIPAASEGIKIGFLIPEPDKLAAKNGGELAIREANYKGGYSGHPFQLVVRSTEGPWGTGSKESVSLVFDDEVVAIMCSLDGRNAHLVEQVAAKTRIMCLSAWATEMTLSQAFVPWHYRCVPNDDQQATSLIEEIYLKRKITNVAIIGSEDYDSKNAVHSFVETATLMNVPLPREFLFKSSVQDFQMTLQEIDQNNVEAIILFGKPALVSDIIPLLKEQNKNRPVFCSFSVMDDQKACNPYWNIFEGVNVVSSGHWFTKKGITFQKAFQETFGYQPGAAAAYAYDGINLLIEVIQKCGPDRDKIIDAFAEMDYTTGVTGEIRFDIKGNRIGIPGILTIKNGNPHIIE